jgi:hypothetical protein
MREVGEEHETSRLAIEECVGLSPDLEHPADMVQWGAVTALRGIDPALSEVIENLCGVGAANRDLIVPNKRV